MEQPYKLLNEIFDQSECVNDVGLERPMAFLDWMKEIRPSIKEVLSQSENNGKSK